MNACLVANGVRPQQGYKTESAGQGLNLEVARGGIAAVIGPSGAERSQWLQTLAGVRLPVSGRLQIMEYELGELDPDELRAMRCKAGYLSPDAPLLSTFDVTTNVMLPRLYHFGESPQEARHVANKLLDGVDYQGSRDVLPAHLDALGTLHALLARALATDPAILFLQEPFDLRIAVEWTAIAHRLGALAHDENRALLVATQNLRFVADYASHIVFVHDGHAQVFAGWQALQAAKRPEIEEFLHATSLSL